MGTKLSFSQIIKNARKARHLSQVDAAEAIGISRSYLAGMESGISLPGRETLAAIATFYGISMDAVSSGGRPQTPLDGEFIEDPDELALVRFWRGLTPDARRIVVQLLRPPGIQQHDVAASH